MSDLINIQKKDAVLLVGLNRPAKRNAMNHEIMMGLRQIFNNIEKDIGAIVLHSTSDHFCSGLDLSDITNLSVIDSLHFFREWQTTFDSIQFGKVPVIAAITGAAVGSGLEMATACHIRVMDESGYFSLPEGVRGIYVGTGASVRFPRLVGVPLMMDMMLTGRILNAKECLDKNAIQYKVEKGKALEKAIELAEIIANNLPMTNYAITHVLPRIVDQSQHDGLLTEALIASVTKSDPRTADRLTDFLERKKAKTALINNKISP